MSDKYVISLYAGHGDYEETEFNTREEAVEGLHDLVASMFETPHVYTCWSARKVPATLADFIDGFKILALISEDAEEAAGDSDELNKWVEKLLKYNEEFENVVKSWARDKDLYHCPFYVLKDEQSHMIERKADSIEGREVDNQSFYGRG